MTTGKYIRKEGRVLSRCLSSEAASVGSSTETKVSRQVFHSGPLAQVVGSGVTSNDSCGCLGQRGNGGGQTPEQVAFPWRTAPEEDLTMWQRLSKALVEVVPQ